jgi:hypothetical protein
MMLLVSLAVLNVVPAITTDPSDYGYFVDFLDTEEVATTSMPDIASVYSIGDQTTIKRQTTYLDLCVRGVHQEKKTRCRLWEFLRR